MAQVWIDLDDIDSLADHSRWWSIEKFNAVSFYRKDYLPGVDDLKQAVIDKIKADTEQDFSGKVFLLTNLRYWGYCYNPVSFYFCYDKENSLRFILSDINNTPWNERHCYVHDSLRSEQAKNEALIRANEPSRSNNKTLDRIKNYKKQSFHFDKLFHVSPFMPMNMFYQWHYQIQQESVLIHMELFDKDKKPSNKAKPVNTDVPLKFYANMNLSAKQLNKQSANRLPLKFPFLCGKVLFGIYWNALKLWLKKVPFYDHPQT